MYGICPITTKKLAESRGRAPSRSESEPTQKLDKKKLKKKIGRLLSKADNSDPAPALPLAPFLSAKRDDAIPREPLVQHSPSLSLLTPSTPTLNHSTRTGSAPQTTPRQDGVHRVLALVFLVSRAQMAPSHDMVNATSPRANRPNGPRVRCATLHPSIIPYHRPIPRHPTVTVTERSRLPGYTRPQRQFANAPIYGTLLPKQNPKKIKEQKLRVMSCHASRVSVSQAPTDRWKWSALVPSPAHAQKPSQSQM